MTSVWTSKTRRRPLTCRRRSRAFVDSLSERNALQDERDVLEEEREQYRKLYLQLIEKIAMLERGFRGQSSERFTDVDKQMSIFILGQLLGRGDDDDAAAEVEPDEPKKLADPKNDSDTQPKKKKPGRRPLPEELPRIDIELVPEEVKRDGLDAFTRVGEEVSETVERRTASLVVVRVTRPKFVRNDRDRDAATEFMVAPAQDLPIERGVAGPNFLAETVTLRFEDHMPAKLRLNRQYRHASQPEVGGMRVAKRVGMHAKRELHPGRKPGASRCRIWNDRHPRDRRAVGPTTVGRVLRRHRKQAPPERAASANGRPARPFSTVRLPTCWLADTLQGTANGQVPTERPQACNGRAPEG